jgi:hypothetical protein
MISIGYTSQRLSFLMSLKVLTLLTCCATNISNNLNFYMMRFFTLCQKCTMLLAVFWV